MKGSSARRVSGRTPKLRWMEGRNIQFDTRWAALDVEIGEAIRKRTRHAATRRHSLAHHTHDPGDAAAHPHHPDHFRVGFRSGW